MSRTWHIRLWLAYRLARLRGIMLHRLGPIKEFGPVRQVAFNVLSWAQDKLEG